MPERQVPAELAPLVKALGLSDEQAAEALTAARELLADTTTRKRLVEILTQELPDAR